MDTRTDSRDVTVALCRGLISAAPGIGPIVAEVVGLLIPNQRIDRIAKLVEALERRVRDLEREDIRLRLQKPEFLDLFEDAVFAGARALTDERIEFIAEILARGLTKEETLALQHKKMLALLSELNEAEVVILRAHAGMPGENREFRQRHRAVAERPLQWIGAPMAVHDEAAVYDSYVQHLVNLGLLENEYGELTYDTPVDELLKPKSQDMTHLGRLFLRTIGVLDEE